jgi:hypothetical protein
MIKAVHTIRYIPFRGGEIIKTTFRNPGMETKLLKTACLFVPTNKLE